MNTFGKSTSNCQNYTEKSTVSYVNNPSVCSRITIQVPQFANVEKCPGRMRQIIKYGEPKSRRDVVNTFIQKQTHLE